MLVIRPLVGETREGAVVGGGTGGGVVFGGVVVGLPPDIAVFKLTQAAHDPLRMIAQPALGSLPVLTASMFQTTIRRTFPPSRESVAACDSHNACSATEVFAPHSKPAGSGDDNPSGDR